MEKEYVKVKTSSLKPYENNPRHNDQAVEAVRESINQVGYITPIIIDENNEILAGHTRLKALAGQSEVEVIKVSGLTEEQKRKYRLLDNKTGELASWDWNKLELELEDLDFGGFDFGFDLPEEQEPNDPKEVKYVENISVVIDCEDEDEAETIFETLTEEGYKCHISTL